MVFFRHPVCGITLLQISGNVTESFSKTRLSHTISKSSQTTTLYFQRDIDDIAFFGHAPVAKSERWLFRSANEVGRLYKSRLFYSSRQDWNDGLYT